MAETPRASSAICTYTNDAIYVRDKSLVDELIGEVTFTQMMFFQIMARLPSPSEVKIVDAVLVTLLEHGITPSAIATRLTLMSAPESLQGAVAAGLLGVGGTFLGTMQGAAELIDEMMRADDGVSAAAERIARRHRESRTPLPGFGHNLHRPDDPRTPKLFAVARDAGVSGDHIAALQALGDAVDRVYGRHITINATGAIAALLSEIGIPVDVMRGFAVITRAAGLVGHIKEERENPAARALWDAATHAVEYSGSALSDRT
ncbi:MAG TPA: citryl-CoA lyase [Gammaproteobacteria bacterium]|nr:citryl-CoA lyase [Gammaproteobacteria bacterium]HCZ48105.1 citryl-CoA lyase [Gammaproteobacteria bacterium]MCH77543.1 citryl-CoA lyase [Gammaproteobacteria bacterium]